MCPGTSREQQPGHDNRVRANFLRRQINHEKT
jgi:hypothetical protein